MGVGGGLREMDRARRAQSQRQTEAWVLTVDRLMVDGGERAYRALASVDGMEGSRLKGAVPPKWRGARLKGSRLPRWGGGRLKGPRPRGRPGARLKGPCHTEGGERA